MRRRAKPGFLLVAAREWRWIMRDRLAPILIFGVPLIAFIALTAIFSSQVIRGLGVVVVDDDRSQTSSIFIEALAASANLKGTSKNCHRSSGAPNLPANDSASFPFRFCAVHPKDARD